MKLILIEDKNTLSSHYQNIKSFVCNVQPQYTTHVIDVLMEWFNCFSSDDGSPFVLKRGINFLGQKSYLCTLFFMLIYDDDEVIAFAPFFRFKVFFAGDPLQYDVIAFCPDSTIFFYNDVLIKGGFEDRAINLLFEFINNYHKETPYIFLMNHIPSSSETLPSLLKNSMNLVPAGFNVSISPVLWRGGLYPWNISKLQAILQRSKDNESISESNRRNIEAAIEKIDTSNNTMLVFKRNHLHLKSSIYSIFGKGEPSGMLFDLYNDIETIFQSYPVKYPYLKLPESSEEFDLSLSSSKRYFYKRYRKQFFAQKGHFIKLHGTSITDQDIKEFISLHRERWGNNSNILNRFTASFIFSFYQQLARNDLLTLFFAIYESERIACLCSIDFKGRREFISSGRSLRHDKLRAGKLLLYEAIIDAIDDGIYFFDFGYGDDAYKSDFNWSFLTNNVIALFYHLHPGQFPNIFPLYEKIIL